jgi:hypothetical protein
MTKTRHKASASLPPQPNSTAAAEATVQVAETPTSGATPIAGIPLSTASRDEKIPEIQLSLTTSQIKEIHRKAGVSSPMPLATSTVTAGTSKTIRDIIRVSREHQNDGKDKDDLIDFAPSDRTMHTPPQ